MNKFIHIGYPKCLSTTLQRCYFSQHPEIDYYGIGINDNIDYISSNISNLIEVYIRYSNFKIFEKKINFFREIINNKFEESLSKGKQAAGISAEILSIGFAAKDNDNFEKARRLSLFFDQNTKIIILIRNQLDFLKSIYRESIRVGYDKTFQEFINFHFKFKCSSLISDIRYDDIYETYCKYFKKRNILIIPYESVISQNKEVLNNNKNQITSLINNHLKIKDFSPNLKNLNEKLNDKILFHKRYLNKSYKHDLGNGQYDLIESHRIINYFKSEGIKHLKKDPYQDVKIKRKLIKKAKLLSKKSEKKINYRIHKEVERELMKFFKKSNNNLEKIAGIKMGKLGYIT
jgi:hypothetical protein